MGEVKPKEWYEETYQKQEGRPECLPTFKPPWPTYSNWHLRLPQMAQWVRKDEKVLDLGCGPGIFAAVLWHYGRRGLYVGVDFSDVQTERALTGNAAEAHQNAWFFTEDITEDSILRFWDDPPYFPDVVVLAEILEHLEDDIELVSRIPVGTKVLITVPTKDDPSHVRTFSQGGDDVLERYGEALRFEEHVKIPRPPKHVRYHVLKAHRR